MPVLLKFIFIGGNWGNKSLKVPEGTAGVGGRRMPSGHGGADAGEAKG